MRFKAEKTGTYEVACAELCGLSHYQMKAVLEVVEPEEYQRYLRESVVSGE